MWVISIAAEIGPITPATIERCNYSATNDKKKKKERNKKWFKGKNGKERGGRKSERKKGILIAGRTEKNVANCR